jgi:ATP-binding cassette, subfamily B, bacterial
MAPVLSRYVLHARLLWHSARWLAVACLALTALPPAARTGSLIASGGLIGALPAAIQAGPSSPEAARAWAWLAATGALFVLAPLATALMNATIAAVSARCLLTVLDLTLEAGSHPYGIGHLEEPKQAGRFAAVAQAPKDWLFLSGVEAGWTYLSIRLGGVGAFAVIATWNWWAALLGAAGWLVLARGFARWSGTLFDDLLETTATDRRRATYFHSVLTGHAEAKEVRLFGLVGWLAQRYNEAWRRTMAAVWKNRNRGLRTATLALAVPFAANVAMFGLLARDAWTGAVTAGAAVTLVQAILALEAFGAQNDPQVALARTTSAVAELVELRNLYGLPWHPTTAKGEQPAPARRELQPAAIELSGVTFAYPDAAQPVLDGLDLRVPAGQSIAIVVPGGWAVGVPASRP